MGMGKKGLFVHILVIPPSLYYFVCFFGFPISYVRSICPEFVYNNQVHRNHGLFFSFLFSIVFIALFQCAVPLQIVPGGPCQYHWR